MKNNIQDKEHVQNELILMASEALGTNMAEICEVVVNALSTVLVASCPNKQDLLEHLDFTLFHLENQTLEGADYEKNIMDYEELSLSGTFGGR